MNYFGSNFALGCGNSGIGGGRRRRFSYCCGV
jgi:hypothetical protein